MVLLKIFAIWIVAGIALGIYTIKELEKQDNRKK